MTSYYLAHNIQHKCVQCIAEGLNQSIKDTRAEMKFSTKQTAGDETEYTVEHRGEKVIFRICNKALRYNTLDRIVKEYIEPAMKHLINKHAESEWNIAYAPAYSSPLLKHKAHEPTEWDFCESSLRAVDNSVDKSVDN